jgi:chromosome segregation ATPase
VAKCEGADAELAALRQQVTDAGASSQEQAQSLTSAQAQVARLQQELDHRAAEADIIKSSRESQEKELEDHKQRLASARDQLFELQGSSAAALQEVGALRRENATHTANLKDLAAELNTRTDELLEARRSHSAAVFGLKTKLTDETEKARQLEDTVSRLEKQLATKTAALAEVQSCHCHTALIAVSFRLKLLHVHLGNSFNLVY